MKKLLFSLFAILSLSSCAPNQNSIISTNENSTNQTSSNESTSIESSNSETSEDFTIKTSDNGLSINKESYILTKANPNETYSDLYNFKIDINIPSKWFITDKNLYKISTMIEDESILKLDALSFDYLKPPTGTGGKIYKIQTKINREKILKTGKTKVKINVVNNTNSQEGTLCFELDIREYEKFEVPTFHNTTVTLVDKDRLQEKMQKYTDSNATVEEITFNTYAIDLNNELYGTQLENQYITNSIKPDTLEGGYSATFEFAKGFEYISYVEIKYKNKGGTNYFYDTLTFNDAIFESYKVTTPNSNFVPTSHLEVFADNLNIDLIIRS